MEQADLACAGHCASDSDSSSSSDDSSSSSSSSAASEDDVERDAGGVGGRRGTSGLGMLPKTERMGSGVYKQLGAMDIADADLRYLSVRILGL